MAELIELELSKIVVQGLQLRRCSDSETIEALKASIAEVGLLQPIVVRRTGDVYELVAGRQRLRAVTELGWETVPARVVELDDETSLIAQAVENINRKDVSPIEEAEYFEELRQRTGWSIRELARRLGRAEAYVRERIQLLSAPAELIDAVDSGSIPFRAARYLRQIDNPVTLQTYIAYARQGGINEETARRWLEDYRRQRELAQALPNLELTPPDLPAAAHDPATAPAHEVTFTCAVCQQTRPIREAVTLLCCEDCYTELERMHESDATNVEHPQS